MKKYYYIISHLSSEHLDMQDGPRIVLTKHGEIRHPKEVGEGPFDNLTELKKNSSIYNSLKISNPKRAQSILEVKNIVTEDNIIFYPDDGSDYLENIYRIMQHSLNGTVNRKGVLGIHVFNRSKIKILAITKPKNSLGVWEAEIEVYNSNSGKWIKKTQPTTFFPDDWDIQRLINECRPAYDEKVKVTETKYIGRTATGIPVTFIFHNGVLSTIYPNYE